MTTRVAFESETGDQVYAVVSAVAEAKGVTPTHLEPLYESLDPELIEMVARGHGEMKLSFEYEGHHVSVSPGGYRIASDDRQVREGTW